MGQTIEPEGPGKGCLLVADHGLYVRCIVGVLRKGCTVLATAKQERLVRPDPGPGEDVEDSVVIPPRDFFLRTNSIHTPAQYTHGDTRYIPGSAGVLPAFSHGKRVHVPQYFLDNKFQLHKKSERSFRTLST